MSLRTLNMLLGTCLLAATGCGAGQQSAPLAADTAMNASVLTKMVPTEGGSLPPLQGIGAKSTSDANASACLGVAEQDRDSAAFWHGRQITGVAPLSETMSYLKFSWNQPRGAAIYIAASPGMTRQWLTRLVECHLADHAGESNATDPLLVPGVNVSVGETRDGFAVYVRTEKPDTDLANRVVETTHQLVQSR